MHFFFLFPWTGLDFYRGHTVIEETPPPSTEGESYTGHKFNIYFLPSWHKLWKKNWNNSIQYYAVSLLGILEFFDNYKIKITKMSF